MSTPLQPNGGKARGLSLAVTNVTKLAGVVLALHEAFGHAELRPSVMMTAALMITGAQGLESFLDRLFGK